MTYDQIAQVLPAQTYSDETLREIILFFRDLEAKIKALGPTWKLARYQCYRELNMFETYASARDWDLNTLTVRDIGRSWKPDGKTRCPSCGRLAHINECAA